MMAPVLRTACGLWFALAVTAPMASAQSYTHEDSLNAALGGTTPEGRVVRRLAGGQFEEPATLGDASRQAKAVETYLGQSGEAWATGTQEVRLRVEHRPPTGFEFSCHFEMNRPLVIEPTTTVALFSGALLDEVPALRETQWTPTMRARAKAWVEGFDEQRLLIPYPFARQVQWSVVGTERGRSDLFTVIGRAKANTPAFECIHPEFAEFATYLQLREPIIETDQQRLELFSSDDTFTFHNVPAELADALETSAPGEYLVVQAAPIVAVIYEDEADRSRGQWTYGGEALPRSRAHVVVRKEAIRRTWIFGPHREDDEEGDQFGVFKPRPKPKAKPSPKK